MQLVFKAVHETQPGPKWQALFREFWPSYSAWWRKRADPYGPSLAQCQRALRDAMPELRPVYDRLVDLSGGDELAARLLSAYQPPPYLIACSQAALTTSADEPILVRNYDLDPNLNEGLILHSRWDERTVMASSEFLWGVADGMNDAGLAVSLAFGGRKIVGKGFSITLILRYILETCADCRDAVEVLRGIPSHMAYNVTVMDCQGRAMTAQVAPDRPAVLQELPLATNHQGRPEWPEHARFTGTLERERWLRQLLRRPGLSSADLIAAFARAPLYHTNYPQGFGTLYTAVYRPARQRAEWRWPDAVWSQDLDDFREGQRTVFYSAVGARVLNPDVVAPDGLDSLLAQLRQSLTGADLPWSNRILDWCDETERRGSICWQSFGQLFASADWTAPNSAKAC